MVSTRFDWSPHNSQFTVRMLVDGVRFERSKNAKGGIDWYRHQTYVLLPRLNLFTEEVIATYCECFLVQDRAPAHNAWQQSELLDIQGLTVLPWPGNSPDLNQIEPCWYHLKQCISKSPRCDRSSGALVESVHKNRNIERQLATSHKNR